MISSLIEPVDRVANPALMLDRCVRLAHGGGGELTARLIADRILPLFDNKHLSPLADSALMPWGASPVVMTTDSYVVTPIEFPGGDIGRLAVCGTVNDLAVMGATPRYLSLGLILEEGLTWIVLDRILRSIAAAAQEAGVIIVTGDTKVVERGASAGGEGVEPGLFINTTGIGMLRADTALSIQSIQPGDGIIVSGRIADHGMTIMSRRAGIAFESSLQSDAAPLNGMIAMLLDQVPGIRFLRDPTRGGLAGVMADIVDRTGLSVEINEGDVPVSPTTRHAAELLGLDPLTVANEGKVVCVAAEQEIDRAVATLRLHPYGRETAIIGRVTDARPPLAELLTRSGGRRIMQRPYGEDLPRIC